MRRACALRVDEEWARSVLNDGTEWEVYKRYFTAGRAPRRARRRRALLAGSWFLVVRACDSEPRPTPSHRIAACPSVSVLDEAWTIYTKFFVKFFVVALIVLATSTCASASSVKGSTATRTATGSRRPGRYRRTRWSGRSGSRARSSRSVQTARTGIFDNPDRRSLRGARPFIGASRSCRASRRARGRARGRPPHRSRFHPHDVVVADRAGHRHRESIDSRSRSVAPAQLVRGNGWTVFGVAHHLGPPVTHRRRYS